MAGAGEALIHDVFGVHATRRQELGILSPQDPGTQDAQVTVSSSRQPAYVREPGLPAWYSERASCGPVILSRGCPDRGGNRRELAARMVIMLGGGALGQPASGGRGRRPGRTAACRRYRI